MLNVFKYSDVFENLNLTVLEKNKWYDYENGTLNATVQTSKVKSKIGFYVVNEHLMYS